ncbi:MAG TPA: serine/threonine-protein kinase [Actinoplanes sp.]|nr:serine/threonine-protein kinase [Actinoplanes sp.]
MRSPLHPDDPTRLGLYTLVSRLGEGGMGTVYLGRDAGGRQVAIKVVRAEYARDDRFRRRFRSEVNRARQVPPFCTAEVLDADPDHNPPYLVVEYIDGPNLTDVVRDHGPLAVANLHGVAVGIATALTAIHGAGVIHRDLKPGNVLFTLGGIKVIDFGIARPLEATSHHTRTDHMVGTIAYMAPERFEPESKSRLSPAADIFSWGAVVAYAATGHTPFSADSAPGTVMRILTQPPDLTGLAEPMRSLVADALAKEPLDRPSARELLDRLLASAPAPQPAATAGRANETPFLREVMESAGRAAPVSPAAGPEPPPIVLRPRPVSGAGAGRAVRSGARRAAAAPATWPMRRWLTQLSVAATVLVMLVAGSLAYRAIGEDGGEPADGAGGAKVPSVLAASSAPADPGGVQAILDGQRRALLEVHELRKNLALSADGSATVSGADRWAFVLVRAGNLYLIRAQEAIQDSRRCLVVQPALQANRLATGSCAESEETLFDLAATGRTDERGRPTYYLTNSVYGTVQWSSDRAMVYVDRTEADQIDTSFVLVDQGPA